MKKIVVWYNPNKNVYYYRITRSNFYERYDYKVGSMNSYNHTIVMIIPFYKIELAPSETFSHSKRSSFLNLFERR